MYYILLLILLIAVYAFIVRLIGSIIRAMLVAFGLFLLFTFGKAFLVSTEHPVILWGLLEIDNFQVRRLHK